MTIRKTIFSIVCKLLVCGLLGLYSITAYAQITTSKTSGCAPLVNVDFYCPDSFTDSQWDFGDGNGFTSNLCHSVHTFSDPGVYLVKYKGKLNGIEKKDSVKITVFGHPKPQFTASSLMGCVPLKVTFTDQTTGVPIVKWDWTYGDGGGSANNSGTQNYTYTIPGDFDVRLTVTDANGCDGITAVGFLKIHTAQKPTAVITSNPSPAVACTAPLDINFSASNSVSNAGGGLTYFWTLGGGNPVSSLESPPTATYSALGDYRVKLQVRDANDCPDTTSILVSIHKPTASFFARNTVNDTVCKTVRFKITSGPGDYLIDFGDGKTSTGGLYTVDSIHGYSAPGFYRVKLKYTVDACSDTTSIPIVVQNVKADFITFPPTYFCKTPFTIKIQDKSINAVKWLWQFADTVTSKLQNPIHTYLVAKEDSFTIHLNTVDVLKLIITSKYGCMDTLLKLANDTLLKPTALFSPSTDRGCVPLTVSFGDNSISATEINQWKWSFGDGGVSTLQYPTHTYNSIGKYYTKLIVTTKRGCVDTSYKHLIQVGNNTHPSFTFAPTSVCANTPVKFTDLSTSNPPGRIDQWHYTADNKHMQACPNDPNPTWGFKDTIGSMNITLTTGYNGCYTDTTITNAITVNGPIAKIKSSKFSCSGPLEYQFTGELFGSTSWDWDFGDGSALYTTTIDKTPSHTYTKSGNYTIKLRAYNSSTGCPPFIDTLLVKVRNIQADFTGAKASTSFKLCLGIAKRFYAKSSIDVAQECGTSYRWYIYDTSATQPVLFVGSNDSVSYAFKKPGTHNVKLEIKGENGCLSTKTRPVKVFQVYAKVTPTQDTTICLSNTQKFSANRSKGDTTLASYQWYIKRVANTPDYYTQFSSLKSPSYSFTNINNSPFNIQLKVQDALGCRDSAFIKLTVSQPDTNITINPAPTNICAGTRVIFKGSNTINQQYVWSFGNGQSSNAANPPSQLYPIMGTDTVKVTITNAANCVARLKRIVRIQDLPIARLITNYDKLQDHCYPKTISFKDSSSASVFQQRYWKLCPTCTTKPDTTVYNSYEKGADTVSLIIETTFGCRDTFTKIMRFVGPTADFILSKDSICKGETILFTLKDTADLFTWNWNFGDGKYQGAVSPIPHQYDFHPTSGKNTVVLTIWSKDSTCRKATDQPKNIFIDQVIAAFKRNNELTKQDTAHCLGITDKFTYITSATNPDIWKWSFGDGQTYIGQNPPLHEYLTAGLDTVLLAIKSSKLGCVDTLRKLMRIYSDPIGTATGDTACYGDKTQLLATGGSIYSWTPTATLNNNSISNPQANPTNNTTYTVLITDINSCTTNKAAIVIIHPKPRQEPLTTSNIVIGETVTLDMGPGNGFTYTWTPATGLSCTNCPITIASPEVDTKYKVVIADTFGCPPVTSYFDFTVKPHALIVLPNAFTPNGDGHNDIIYARGRGIKRLLEFKIYNRWGQLMFDTQDMDQGWDGTFEGKPQPADTYVYTVSAEAYFKNDLFSQKGSIELLR